ncbi:MAG TPA: gamma-glutamyl-gamma-aminobutyrate hydrolase family protein [Armatimonadetes bacterium]|nr:gamma-glutamyl-gamma-aminobutyrate hydrolase family protein [Armatimonadota bacterium]
MRPLIGVTSSTVYVSSSIGPTVEANQIQVSYLRCLERAGAVPVILPSALDPQHAERLLEPLAGLLLAGGVDMDPAFYGEEPEKHLGSLDIARDRMELALGRLALARDLPVLGICRGIQTLNVLAGGTLYQDITHRPEFFLQHRQQAPGAYPTHTVEVQPNTLLHRLVGADTVRTNTFHHQAVKEVAPDFLASAQAGDGVVEAIESPRYRFALGVQWHPELMYETDETARRIFAAFVAACAGNESRNQPEMTPAMPALLACQDRADVVG